ncbi:GNAT family N-acetyltransferase [Bacillus sp. HC-TM]
MATVVSAALILDCLENGKYPNWDAANTTVAKPSLL